MNEEEIKKDLITWMKEFVEKPNSLLGNWAPCPYARQARLQDKVDITFVEPEFLLSRIRLDTTLWKDNEQEAIVYVFDHKKINARDLAERLPETTEEREQRELDEHKIKLQKQKDVVDLWNTIIEYMDKKDRKLLDKTKFPMDLKKEITSDIKKTYKYTNEDEVILEPVEFNYFDKFHPENQGTFRTFSERRVTYKDKDLPPHVDPEPEVDFYFEFDKDNVDDIKSMCLRLRNHIATNRPIDFYWLYIEATPLVDGKKSGESKYESFYTFETKPDLFKRILKSREKRNDVLRAQKQSESESGSKLPSESQSRTSGRKKKKTRGNGKVKGSVKRKRSKRR